MSRPTGKELCLFNNVRRQSVSQCVFAKICYRSLSSVFVAPYSKYGFSVTKRRVWSTLNGLFTCSFDVVRVKCFALVVFSQCIRAIRTTQTDHLSGNCHSNYLGARKNKSRSYLALKWSKKILKVWAWRYY